MAVTIWCSLPSSTEQVTLTNKRDLSGEKRWYDGKCKMTTNHITDEEIKWFHVPDHGFEKCSLKNCPTRSKTKFNVDHCSICCWADLIGECLLHFND